MERTCFDEGVAMGARVVVGYDASSESAVAVRWAAAWALRRGLPLDVVHVWGFAGETAGGAGGSWLGTRVAAAVQDIADEGAKIAEIAAPGVDAHGIVDHGSPTQVFVDRSYEADLVVLGRHGTGRFAGTLIGSVASGVLHHAVSPVVVVPEEAPLGSPRGSVVVGVDGSEGSLGALESAATIAAGAAADLTVVTSWLPVTETTTMSYWALAYPDVSPDEQALDRAERILAAARERLAAGHAGLRVAYVLERGRAQEALVRHSRHADLVVVGTRGRGGLAGLVLGSVSRAVAQRATCPVLVTRTAPGEGPTHG